MISALWTRLSANRFVLIAAAASAAVLLVTAIFLLGGNSDERDDGQPKLGLVTTLPLFWGEGDLGEIIQQASEPTRTYQRLDSKYQVRLIDAIDDKSLRSMHLLLLAQPRALAASELVTLDRWVRRGGHLMVMADPALQWKSAYPLGDRRRPLFTSMMSPLFKHWGLELVLPISDDTSAEAVRQHGGLAVHTVTLGAWQQVGGTGGGACAISADGLVAECKIGNGSAFLVADADMLDDALWVGSGIRALSGSDDFDNMRWVEANLERLWVHRVGRK